MLNTTLLVRNSMGENVHRSHNGLKTAALLGLLSSIILLIGWAFGGSSGLIIAFVIALGMNGVSYFFSDKIALRSMGAQPVTEAEAPAAVRDRPRTVRPRERSRCRACT